MRFSDTIGDQTWSLQIAQDTLAFRYDVPISLFDIASFEKWHHRIPMTFDRSSKSSSDTTLFLRHLASNPRKAFELIKLQNPSESWEKCKGTLGGINVFWKTDKGFSWPITTLIEEYSYWRLWLFAVTASSAISSWSNRSHSPEQIFRFSDFMDEPESHNSPFRYLHIMAIPFPRLDSVLLVGPVLNLGPRALTHQDHIEISTKLADHISDIHDQEVSAYYNQYRLTAPNNSRLVRKLVLRCPIGTNDLRLRSQRISESLTNILDVDITAVRVGEDGLFTTQIMTLAMGLDFFLHDARPWAQRWQQLRLKLLTPRDDDDREIGSDLWLVMDSKDVKARSFSLLKWSCSNDLPELSGFTRRLAATGPDSIVWPRHDDEDLSVLDTLLSQRIDHMLTHRTVFMHEQFRLMSTKLDDNFGTWIRGNNGSAGGTPRPHHPEAFGSALKFLAQICNRVFRADIVSLYRFDVSSDKLVFVGSKHNSRDSQGYYRTGYPNIPGTRLDTLMEMASEQRTRSIAYRCVDGYGNTYLKDIAKLDRLRPGAAPMVLTKAYRILGPQGSEFALTLPIFDKVWGVLVITGYQPHHFEARVWQNAKALADLFAAAIYQTWFSYQLHHLNKAALSLASTANKNNVVPATDVSKRSPQSLTDVYNSIAQTICSAFLVKAASIWVQKGESGIFDCKGQHGCCGDVESQRDMLAQQDEFKNTLDQKSLARTEAKTVVYYKIERHICRFGSCNEEKCKLKCFNYVVPLRDSHSQCHTYLCLCDDREIKAVWEPLIDITARHLSTLFETTTERETFVDTLMITLRHTMKQEINNVVESLTKLKKFFSNAPDLSRIDGPDRWIDDGLDNAQGLTQNIEAIKYNQNRQWILQYSKKYYNDKTTSRVRRVLFDTIKQTLAPHRPGEEEREIYSEPSHDLIIAMPEKPLKVIFDNVYQNALKYKILTTKVRIGVQTSERSISIYFSNISYIISDTEFNAIWLPGVRSKKAKELAAEGDGMGLYMAREIAKEWGLELDGDMRPFNDAPPFPQQSGSEVSTPPPLVSSHELVWYDFRLKIPRTVWRGGYGLR
jgi:hypothetical protein